MNGVSLLPMVTDEMYWNGVLVHPKEPDEVIDLQAIALTLGEVAHKLLVLVICCSLMRRILMSTDLVGCQPEFQTCLIYQRVLHATYNVCTIDYLPKSVAALVYCIDADTGEMKTAFLSMPYERNFLTVEQ